MTKFWGLTVFVGKKFKQQVQEPFCISGAALEPLDSVTGKYDDKPIQLYLQQDDHDHLICSLSAKQSILQVALNVRIGNGETIGFHLKGGSPKSRLHLTGYTIPRGDAVTPPAGIPFKGQQKSILVTDRKASDAQKKRVSIVETEPFGEKEESESSDDIDDEDAPTEDIRRKLFNGENADSDDDDDDDDDSSEMDEDEIQELQQLVKKEQFNPFSSGKGQHDDSDDDDDDDLELLDDEDDDDSDESNEDDSGIQAGKSHHEKKQLSQANKKSPPSGEKKETSNSSSKKQETPSKNKDKKSTDGSLSASATPKTPENQKLKLTAPSSAGHTPMKTFSKGGVLVNDVKIGNGQVAKSGKMVAVYYVGRLKSNNKQFDASQNGPGFKFRLGKGEVIKGWDLGVEGMKVGGKRRLTIPAQLAYGKRGAPPDIPPNATLLFDVELKSVS